MASDTGVHCPLLEEQGFSVRYQSTNDNPWYIVYVFTVASPCGKNIGSLRLRTSARVAKSFSESAVSNKHNER